MSSVVGVMLMVVAAGALRQAPGRAGLLPFKKIAEEIGEAERTARNLEWEVGNTTAEKDSVQWFMATAMKELNKMKKVTLNASFHQEGEESVAFKYESCYNQTVARMPDFNTSLTLGENLAADHTRGVDTVEAKMYDVYEANYNVDELTTQLGECAAKCPLGSSFLAKKTKVSQPAGAPAGASQDPKEFMSHIAGAIRNTSETIEHMGVHLKKDRAAMDVLESVTSAVVEKLLMAKKSVAQMEQDLADCLKTPAATALHDEVADAMKLNPEVSEDMVEAASDRAKESTSEVDELKEKLEACKQKCGDE